MPTKKEINNLIIAKLSKLPRQDEHTLEFLIKKIFEWFQPHKQQDNSQLEKVLEILISRFDQLGPVDESHSEELKEKILKFLKLKKKASKQLKKIDFIIFPNQVSLYIVLLVCTSLLSAIVGVFVYRIVTVLVTEKPSITFDKISELCSPQQYKGRNNEFLNTNCGKENADDQSNSSALIFKNNQDVLERITSKKLSPDQVYPIASVVPFSSQSRQAQNVANDMLKGVAEAQENYNKSNKSKAVFVMIADDKNDIHTGQDIAQHIGQKSDIVLGVVGSYSSSNSSAAIPVYTKYELVLVSPTATATLEDIQDNYQRFLKQEELDFSFFFRPVASNKYLIKETLQYLSRKNYKKIGIFWDDKDTYSQSLYNELNKQNQNFLIAFEERLQDKSRSYLEEIIIKMKQDKRNPQNSTAIFIFQGAHKDKSEKNEVSGKAKAIISANQSHFLVVASNTVYQADLMCTLSNAEKLDNLLIMQSWFPEPDNILFPKPVHCDETNKHPVNYFSPWASAMSYDATQMLIWAIEKASDEGKTYPTRKTIQEALMSNDIQQSSDCLDHNKGIKNDTKTGIISLHGSDRCNPSSELIYPLYIKETNQWLWKTR